MRFFFHSYILTEHHVEFYIIYDFFYKIKLHYVTGNMK